MSDQQGQAATWGNPTVADPANATFPFDRYAAGILNNPGQLGLVTDPAVHGEFLAPPGSSSEWFSHKAWDATAQILEHDPAITFDMYDNLKQEFNAIEASLVQWTQLRDPATATDGHGDLSAAMRKAGSDAYAGIRSITKTLATSGQDPNVAAATHQALDNFGAVLWEYAQCMAYELEASNDETDVNDIRDRVANEVTNPWEPAVDPDNVDDPA